MTDSPDLQTKIDLCLPNAIRISEQARAITDADPRVDYLSAALSVVLSDIDQLVHDETRQLRNSIAELRGYKTHDGRDDAR